MIGNGQWHKLIPKDYEANLRYRKEVLQECAKSSDFRSGILEICSKDILFFINTFCYQFNPQNKGEEVGPFITWDFQDEAILELISAIEEGEDLRIEKSREMGATWICLLVMLWYCLFHHWKKFLLISRDEDSVDRVDDPDSLFWKLTFAVQWLPNFMKMGVSKKKMGMKFALTNCTINGEAATGKAGVGGRATAAFLDEFSQNPNAAEVWARTADTTSCRIVNFTHVGQDTMAYTLCYDEQYEGMRSILMHWSQHPEKRKGLYRYDTETNDVVILDTLYKFEPDFVFVMDGKPVGGPFPCLRSPWYDLQCRRRPARAIAMDLDIDPRGATKQFYEAVIIANLKSKYCEEPYWVGDLIYNKDTGEPVKLVEKVKGSLKLWTHPRSATELSPMRCGAGADLSWGTGATPSCLSAADMDTGKKVAEYINAHLPPAEAAVLFVAICRFFKSKGGQSAKLAWELQGPGVVFGRRVMDLGFTNVFWRKDEDLLGGSRAELRPGWVPNPKSILALHSDYWDALRNKWYINPSWHALDEALNFVWTTTSVEYRGKRLDVDDPTQARVHHGDIVVADALSFKMIKGEGRMNPESIEKTPADLRTFAGRIAIMEELAYNFEADPLAGW